MLQVAVQPVGQAGMAADETRLDSTASKEHRRGGAVVSAFAGVLFHPATKLTEAQQQHAALMSVVGMRYEIPTTLRQVVNVYRRAEPLPS